MTGDSKSNAGGLSCGAVCRIVGAIVGVCAAAILIIWVGSGMVVAIVVGIIVFILAAYLLKNVFCSEAPVVTQPAKAPQASEPVAAPAAKPAKAPAAAPAKAEESKRGRAQPAALSAARDGKADDLRMIKGVGPGLQKSLNEIGIFHFDQIAGWSAAEVDWVDNNLAKFKGRATRDGWVEQAKTLASGGETDFSGRVKKGDVY